jgi:major vault protein
VRSIGSYLPGVREYVVAIKNGYILSEKNAVHLRASKNFTDVYGHKRVAGQEWLVTRNDAQIHIPDVFEEVVKEVEAVSLNSLQYVVLLNPYDM